MSEVSLDRLREFGESIEERLQASFEDAPTLDDDARDEINQVRDRLLDGLVALESIIQEDGVSKNMLVSLEDILPEQYPLKSFTEQPSHTNLDVAVVSLEEKNWGLIVTIGLAIAGLIARIIQWLFSQGNSYNSNDVDRAVRIAQDTQKRIDDAEQSGTGEAVQNKTDQVNDSVNGGNWSQLKEAAAINPTTLIKQIFNVGDLIYNKILGTVEETTQVIDQMVQNEDNPEMAISMLERKQKLLDGLVQQVFKSFNNEGFDTQAQDYGLDDLMTDIKAKILDMDQQAASDTFDIRNYTELLSDRKVGLSTWGEENRDVDLGAQSAKDLQKRLSDLHDKLKKLDPRQIKVGNSRLSKTDSKKTELEAQIQQTANHIMQKTMVIVNALSIYSGIRLKVIKSELSVYQYLKDYNKSLR